MAEKKIPRVQAFLAAIRETGSVSKAAEAAQVRREGHYRRYKRDPAYAAAFDCAMDDAVQLLEDEAVRRAHDGVTEEVFYQGKRCGQVQRYSDGLLMFLLRARRPDRYRERTSVEHSGPGGAPMQTKIEVTFVRADAGSVSGSA